MTARSNIIYAATMACALAGCANDGSLSTGLNTGSVNPQTAADHKVAGSPVSHTRFAN